MPTLRASIDDLMSGTKTTQLAAHVERLSALYRAAEPATVPILATDAAVLAYAAYRMPATYAVARASLQHLRNAIPDLQPRTLLDLGAGTGAVAWAATEVWPAISEVRLREQSGHAIALGKRLMESSGSPTLQGAQWQRWQLPSSRDADVPANPAQPAKPDVPVDTDELADLGTAAYVLGELTPDQQTTLLRALTTAARTVVVIEPGTPAGFGRIINARSHLLESGFTIAAPCPHELTCPMLARNDWCHFAERLERSSLHRALKAGELSYEDEKFSYVAAVRTDVHRPVLHRSDDRILRHPTQRKGLVSLQLCDASGQAIELKVSKSQGLYKAARHAEWGDGWAPAPADATPPPADVPLTTRPPT
jgi:ribosomal protein RSM22 (predicted rRNA methylase)